MERTIERTIERLGLHGDGVAPGPVYVSGALPGEVVRGEVSNNRIDAPKIVVPSPDRVRPPCRHAKSCGGCALQHASDGFVARWKQEVVETALAAQGLKVPVSKAQTSPPRSRRRATLSARRTKKGALVGFHARASDMIVEITDCQLLHPDILAALPALHALTLIGASRKGEIRFSVTASLAGADISAKNVKPADAEMGVVLAALAETHQLARLTWQDELIAQRAPPAQSIGAAQVVPPPGAFLQATKDGENSLLSAVTETISGATQIVDFFAGCGTFSLPAAANAEVHAVESDAAMLAALDTGWRQASGLKRITTEVRDLFRNPLLADDLRRFDAAIIDPPRAGAEAQANAIGGSGIVDVAMVSCNPASFARDARILVQGGYRLVWVQVGDLRHELLDEVAVDAVRRLARLGPEGVERRVLGDALDRLR
ncbi:MAG: class I SAM-dependent RNA methyltransferase, partial [Halocynthiibacter sp.]